jgi:hypothetical protein
MNAQRYLTASLLLSLSIVLLTLISGCAKSTKPLATPPKIEIDWGKAGTAPDRVWDENDWIIMSRSHYEGTCK